MLVLLNVQPKVDKLAIRFLSEFDLLEDRIRSDGEAGILRVEKGVNGRHGHPTAIDDGNPRQFIGLPKAKFDRMRATSVH